VTQLTFGQIEDLWIANGGSPGWAPLAAGIAMAESGGDPGALNNNSSTGDYSVGLWQINYFGSLLAPRTASYGSPSTLQADPNAQARAAVALSNNGANWGPWRTDRAWQAWTSAGSPSMPNSTTVQGWLGAGGVPTGGSATLLAATGSNSGVGGSILPGVPATAPAAPSIGLNPLTDAANIFSWATQFGAWALFVLIILLFGMILLSLGVLMLVVLLASPVASPVADVVGGGVVGRATKGVRSSVARGGPGASSGPGPRAQADAEVARARHGPARGGASPRGSRVPARHAIAEHNRQDDAEQRYLRAHGRAQDRRNRGPASAGRLGPRQPASSTRGRSAR